MANIIERVQVFGVGCSTCETLHALTQQAVKDAGLDVTVEYVTDMERMLEQGIMQSPALVVNGVVVFSGKAFDAERVRTALAEAPEATADTSLEAPNMSESSEAKPATTGCPCGGTC